MKAGGLFLSDRDRHGRMMAPLLIAHFPDFDITGWRGPHFT